MLTLTADIEAEETNTQWKAQITRNGLGQEMEKQLNGRIKLTTAYDKQGRIISHQVYQGSKETYNRQYNWSPGHQLKSILNGLTKGKTEFTYDSFGSLASACYQDGSYDYKLPDEVGNLYSDPHQSDTVYGASGKILKDKKWNYIYDPSGNLILKTSRKVALPPTSAHTRLKNSPFALDSPTTQKGFWIEDLDDNDFDRKAEIRRYSKSELKQYDQIRKNRTLENADPPQWQPGDWEYQWQGNGMLKAVRNPQGEWIRFEYDALGRRTAKIVHTKIYRYLWDGNVLLHEWHYERARRPKVITDELGMLILDQPEPVENLTTWVYEEGSLVPTAKLCEGKSYSIVSDYLGRPAQAYDDKGELVWQVEFDIYGRIREDTFNNQPFIPFRQLGQYEDVETGLYYNRFRYYNPESGSYISQDPIGLAGNNPNFYAYTFDSNTQVDPFGLDVIANKASGNAREAIAKKYLQNKYPNATILSERYIRDANGKSVRDITNSRRRLDFIVVEDGKVKGIFEVTSPTADKTTQMLKEAEIRANGGTHVKEPGRKGKMYDISEVETKRIDVDLETGKVKCH
ncbi:hypothetical protein A9G48_00695 [Gilliamella sp. wkB18]|uniref:RHS repeat domain-containing protein n=1 Tax=Gilliamella sp. wkB18 TaxID=3120260 RepID=UPI00080E989E|nr:RHS repeat-associated core domain-containing protein [Gilliamella apicola]OCG65149.1 hypothetical protein A9G48_00695 [Gilliamella apicola]